MRVHLKLKIKSKLTRAADATLAINNRLSNILGITKVKELMNNPQHPPLI